MKLWLDDKRSCPSDWVRAHSVNEAIALIEVNRDNFEYASLDHDLGIYAEDGGDGIELTQYMLTNNIFPSIGIRVHSASMTGTRDMLSHIDQADPYGDSEAAIYGFNNWRGQPPESFWPVAGMF